MPKPFIYFFYMPKQTNRAIYLKISLTPSPLLILLLLCFEAKGLALGKPWFVHDSMTFFSVLKKFGHLLFLTLAQLSRWLWGCRGWVQRVHPGQQLMFCLFYEMYLKGSHWGNTEFGEWDTWLYRETSFSSEACSAPLSLHSWRKDTILTPIPCSSEQQWV